MTQPLTDAQFSIIRGGLVERFLILLRVTSPDKAHTLRKIIFFCAISWLPLLVLSAIEGLLWGDKVQLPFLKEFATHARFLIAIPLMLVAEVIVDNRVKISLHQFIRAGLLPGRGTEQFELAKKKADRMCESFWAEAAILVLIVLYPVFRIAANSISITTWVFPDSANLHTVSLAGYWALTVSLPLFQFLLLRWLWRWMIWFRLLFLVSKSGLRLFPAHPDKAGGLGFLGEPPAVFAPITLMLGVVFAAMLAEHVVYNDFKLHEHYPLIGVFAAIAVIMNVAPLLVFMPPMSLARRKGVLDYNALIVNHHRGFEDKWIKPQGDESILGDPDPSSAADLNSVYEAVTQMKIFPFNIKIMMVSIVISLLPLLPVFALQMPIADILKMLAGILL